MLISAERVLRFYPSSLAATQLYAGFHCAKLTCFPRTVWTDMQLSKEYVGYLAHQVVKRLIDTKFIETKNPPAVNERVNAALLEEITMEDRINDEVRVILEAYSDEMRKGGVNYQEMFKKVKNELVRKYRAVL
jgi:hypothetical protein